MSHFTKVKTELKNLLMLKQTLDDLNLNYVEADAENQIQIKGWNNEEEEVLMEIKTGGPYSIGVVKNNETNSYEFIADWWGVEMYLEKTQEEFVNQLSQKYAYNTVIEKIQAKGYDISTEEVDEENNLRIVLRKWD
jgi:hypothetical protein